MSNNQPAFNYRFLFLLSVMMGLFGSAVSQSYPPTTNCPRSQKQAEVWYFGDYAGIDFRSGVAVALTDQQVMQALKPSSVISDSAGNLRFFTTGKRAWDRSFNPMPNATNLAGSAGGTQPCIIIGPPGATNKYYLFSLDLPFIPNNTGLTYTIFDMDLNNGYGDATDILGVPLLNPVCQKITAVNNRDKSATWVIVHKWESADFYAYPVTIHGIGPPVITTVGSVHGGGVSQQMNSEGSMKASPDGKKIALAISGENKIELFDFNDATGTLTNARSFTTTDAGINPIGIEFSPDSRMLYVSLIQRGGSGPPVYPSIVYQFDLAAGLTNPVQVHGADGVRLSTLQLAPDGRIYVTRTINHLQKIDSLDVIYNPRRPGVSSNYSRLGGVGDSRFPLGGRAGLYSLPNFNQSYFHIPSFRWNSVCHGDLTQFYLTNRANIDSVSWDFGDGMTTSGMDASHLYASPGTYRVSMTEFFAGEAFTDTVSVTVYPLPEIRLSDTVLLYSGTSINLHAGGGFMEYVWSTGSRDSVINVSLQGSYQVQVKDFNCCLNQDTTYVRVFDYYVPTAFTPNGDGRNDRFQVIGVYRNITFSLVVYDRWGTLLYESHDIADPGWDGTSKGQNCPPDLYVWKVNIGFLGQDIKTSGDVVFKGTVTLVR